MSPRLTGDAHAVQARALASPDGPATGSHATPRLGHLGIGWLPTWDGPRVARAPDGTHIWVHLWRVLVVLGRLRAAFPAASCVGAHPPGHAPPYGTSAPCLTPVAAARRCGLPPPSWRGCCYVASWRGACGRRHGSPATVRGPARRAPTARRRMRTKSTSSGTSHSGSGYRRHGALGCETRRKPSPSWGRLTSGLPACGGQAACLSYSRRGSNSDSWTSFRTCTACTLRSSLPA